MKVRTSSWHYRLWRFGRENSRSQPRDLCRYFWHLVLLKLLLPGLIAGAALVGVGCLVWLIWGHPVGAGITVLTIMLAIALGFGLAVLIRRIDQRSQAKIRERRLHPRPLEEPKEPSVLRQFLSARKRKLCPLIEVVNDTERE